MMKKKKKTKTSSATSNGLYTVIKFIETNAKLFDCIPDIWFADIDKESCFWPPKGKSVAIRAFNQDIPDESWERYNCEIVKGGFGELAIVNGLIF